MVIASTALASVGATLTAAVKACAHTAIGQRYQAHANPILSKGSLATMAPSKSPDMALDRAQTRS